MLKVKYLTLFKPKKGKGGNFYQGLKKSRAMLDFFLQPSVAFLLDFNQNLVLYQMQVILGR